MADVDHALFWKKFATMLGSGVPLAVTLGTLRDEHGDAPFGLALERVLDDLKSGVRFSQALGAHPRFFGADLVQIVRGGEGQGRLDEVAATVGERFDQGVLRAPAPCPETIAAAPAAPSTGPTLDQILKAAVDAGASDIHFEPFRDTERRGRIRMRVDGVLREHAVVPSAGLDSLVAGLKTMSCLDVAETVRPQDGRVMCKVGGDPLDFRLATSPSVYGEAACVRVIDARPSLDVFKNLARIFPEETLRQALVEAARSSHGLIIATGPTGSGKTTSALALLAQVDATACKVVTVEDPVEVVLPGVHHIQARLDLGHTIPGLLRHVLRMDPDALFCGEVRDAETALLLLQIALTGHLVITQLHAGDAPGALCRLLDIGLEPYLVADALRGILAQRLVRRLCPTCRRPAPEARERAAALTGRPLPAGGGPFEAPGCPACGGTGFAKGRRAVYEFLRPGPALRHHLVTCGAREGLVEAARADGWRPILEANLDLMASGEISLGELLRVCPPPVTAGAGIL